MSEKLTYEQAYSNHVSAVQGQMPDINEANARKKAIKEEFDQKIVPALVDPNSEDGKFIDHKEVVRKYEAVDRAYDKLYELHKALEDLGISEDDYKTIEETVFKLLPKQLEGLEDKRKAALRYYELLDDNQYQNEILDLADRRIQRDAENAVEDLGGIDQIHRDAIVDYFNQTGEMPKGYVDAQHEEALQENDIRDLEAAIKVAKENKNVAQVAKLEDELKSKVN